jgi:hypothetical protein
MMFLAYLNRIALDSASIDGAFRPRSMYIFLNLVVPLILGILLALGIKIVKRMAAPQKRRNN